MPFSDPRYLVFLGLVFVVFAGVRSVTARLATVVLASHVFYGFLHPGYPLLLATLTLVTWSGGLALARVGGSRRHTAMLTLLLALIATPLLALKYAGGLSAAVGQSGFASLVLPIGISFYTFQALAYVADVYIGTQLPERRLLRFAAFMSFFPQLLAGPIVRGRQLLPQLDRVGTFEWGMASAGLRLILLGLAMKVVIADALAPLVDRVYTAAASSSATDIMLATTYFSFQVYADFAGYSLIAIGSARLLGIELPQNFEQPYFSSSLPEYWRRWHMTLSAWARDYVFTPLQFKWRHLGRAGLAGALLVTFVVIGMWHGAGWKYFWFGVVHGALVSAATLTLRQRTRFWRALGVPAPVLTASRVVLTFVTVTLTFVLFRALDVETAAAMYRSLVFGPFPSPSLPVVWPGLAIAALVALDLVSLRGGNISRVPAKARWAIYHAGTVMIVIVVIAKYLLGAPHVQQFIYFQF